MHNFFFWLKKSLNFENFKKFCSPARDNAFEKWHSGWGGENRDFHPPLDPIIIFRFFELWPHKFFWENFCKFVVQSKIFLTKKPKVTKKIDIENSKVSKNAKIRIVLTIPFFCHFWFFCQKTLLAEGYVLSLAPKSFWCFYNQKWQNNRLSCPGQKIFLKPQNQFLPQIS